MRCVVIDDEPFSLDLIKDYIQRTPFLELTQCFSNPFKALDYLNREKVDVIFLDINMPELSGIQLIRALQTPPMVVFTTAYPEFAAESYEYNAVDYLVKPVKYERFLKAVSKASGQIGSTKQNHQKETAIVPGESKEPLFIKSGNQLVKVWPSEILYIEAAGNYMCFHTRERKVMSLLTMKEVLEMLSSDEFIRIHKSFVISLKHLEAIERHDVVVGGKQIPIGITYREQFLTRVNR
ncbi:LytR/AlgR family response regulator transcription factor [Perlabentimonas gracilis]|uniref:LytR/AlgR family response regulator transcription factor n=1 Tax=Perlabentimonas gracilis TaxID=2715279 RepID=UPI0014095373|nr:response regulator transcription factor [Perlabentimonas gracilis]NHB67172.1 response regulator transcription factor [Perlabentimonas gracilis]